MSRITRRLGAVLGAVLITAALTACNIPNPFGPEPTVEWFVTTEQRRVIELAGTPNKPGEDRAFDATLHALVGNGFRPLYFVGQKQTGGTTTGTILWKHCPEEQTFQACAASVPTPTNPSIKTGGTVPKTAPAALFPGGIALYSAVVGSSMLDCRPATGAGFQANLDTIGGIKRVFEAFSPNGQPIGGDKDVSWSATKNGPAQTTTWHCDLSAAPTPSGSATTPASSAAPTK